MFKSVFAATAALSLSASAALAGPYVNIENNTGFTGSDYDGTVTETHAGYESSLGDSAAWYIQAGPAFVAADGEDLETEISGKVGVGVDVTDNVNVYGEVGFITDEDDNGYGTKVGLTYSF
tara:strand:+ start:591 stop:953 length:363 start_codon:yes stop_codon:yes gene_type:complete